MAHNNLRVALLAGGDEAATNEAMVHELERSGALRTPACIAAFRAVDRRRFWIEGGRLAYTDAPLRHGRLHQSAPHIYARALEAMMPLHPGLSFLNLGSGTGYFSSIVSELTGETSINDGLELWPEAIAHAEERCRQIGKRGIEFTQGNVYQLDPNVGMRYDRIYIGACVCARGRYLYGLLEVGGILVGPFQDGRTQHLRRVVRLSETSFRVEVLNSVHFASLVEPPAASPGSVSAPVAWRADSPEELPVDGICKDGRVVGLPDVPFTFALRQQPWSIERSWAYPLAFRAAAVTALQGRPADPKVICLPAEIWQKEILPWCPRWWFEPTRDAPVPASPARAALGVLSAALKRTLLARSKGARRESWESDAPTRAPSLADSLPGSLRGNTDSPPLSRATSQEEAEAGHADAGEVDNLLVLVLDQNERESNRQARRQAPTPQPRRGFAGAVRCTRGACTSLLRVMGRCYSALPPSTGIRRGYGLAVRSLTQLGSFAARCAAAAFG